MKLLPFLIAPLVLASVWGCEHTAEGAKKDIQIDSQKASEKLKEGMDNASNVAANAGNSVKEVTGTAELTLKVKNAINADKELNDPKNLIDVDTTKDSLTLNGHVTSAALKEKAEHIAKEEIEKAKESRAVENNLVVQK